MRSTLWRNFNSVKFNTNHSHPPTPPPTHTHTPPPPPHPTHTHTHTHTRHIIEYSSPKMVREWSVAWITAIYLIRTQNRTASVGNGNTKYSLKSMFVKKNCCYTWLLVGWQQAARQSNPILGNPCYIHGFVLRLYSERPRGAGFRSVNPAERWRENPARALARAGFSQHLECGIHRSESSPEGSFALIPRPVARWAKTTP